MWSDSNFKSTVSPQELVQELRDEGLPVLSTLISASVKVRESHQRALPMIHLDARHKVAQEFEALYDELESARGAASLKKKRA